MNSLYIGLMSGTSLDGVDAVLVDLGTAGEPSLVVLGHVHRPFAPALAAEFLALNTPGANELHRAALAANALAEAYAGAVEALLEGHPDWRAAVRAVGAHGQTVRHAPGAFDATGYTLQLNQPALLAERTGLNVVADFRSRDLAAGGQAAPLVPAFHRAVFGRAGQTVAVLNLGGIANLTLLHADGRTTGFDCGPANTLLDVWAARHLGRPFDDGGRWAAGGRVLAPLLAALLSEPYFAVAPPKSTGRDLFHAAWLEPQLTRHAPDAEPQDVQATLTELTVAVCAADLRRHASDARELIVCGGGACNDHMMSRLAATLPGVQVKSSTERGLPPNQVEACAFAWLARAHCEQQAGNLPDVTGARGPRVLGALYPA